MQRPLNGEEAIEEWEVERDGVKMLHTDFSSTLDDIFRKIDLVLNRTLDHEELNQLGAISGIKFF